jgi:hypothetical protein
LVGPTTSSAPLLTRNAPSGLSFPQEEIYGSAYAAAAYLKVSFSNLSTLYMGEGTHRRASRALRPKP